MIHPFLTLEHITVRHLDNTLFHDLSWQVEKGQHWAIMGSSGAGKSALLNTIAGRFNVINGTIRYHFYDDFIATHPQEDPYFNYRRLLATVSHHHQFKNLSHTSDFYYQQRFNSSDAQDAPTVQTYLFGDAPVDAATMEWLTPLRIPSLLHKELIKLSNGETRRTMIAYALLQKPRLLMLDNPFIGLDVQARKDFQEMINHIIGLGTTVFLVTSPQEIPDMITHVLTLDDGKVAGTYTRSEYLAMPHPTNNSAALPSFDKDLVLQLTAHAPREHFHTIVDMKDVHVTYGEAQILQNINWTILPNDKWALLGPNGAGKSTLLSLINADNPQSYANNISLFDRQRGSGESIWDIKRRIGFVSPELHQYFTSQAHCLQIVASGFHDTIGALRGNTPEQLDIAMGWMKVLDIDQYANQPFKQVPESIQRIALLARALVKNPPLLIFDEPFQGLDAKQKEHFKQVIASLCDVLPVTLIFVTHYLEELPASVDKFLRLDKGHQV
ncbi:molybdate transport system ATP-binding protein [Chitinophaga costaii]|uniref:Molybdate transport system ATP-binding protein n=1 Tax=Chitinophaga costaii TaxID=1335309 RepID=A0A1C4DN54_9BACT|nr:ATP-binding cassette domain-containing protein [Chitinophaga costaii]PUZ27708.1 ABC transporter [Chitinophaga costaii]SCC32768.1 molybdate transport system ATP-binding protein [Chitinophaga costaii]